MVIKFKNSTYFALSLLCFLVDLCCYALFDHQLLYTILLIFVILLVQHYVALLAIPALFICLEFFIFYGQPFVCIWCIFPLIIVHAFTYRQVYMGPWYPALLAGGTLLIQIFFIEFFLIGTQESLTLALTKLTGNAILYLGFFLKLNE